ncbi:cation transporter [Cohnella sp. LGH]|uniref:Cation diffusion facilitator family transporter n=1 Tax=Cohnella phaseoli TaxID=456490 RepID=A0A3D9HQA9_9BACL|nr:MULTISPECIES: cation diffusion facilitator family transporter [Cohnella]QTH42419.1 cation transporter [Cohnella sp. LGH]RED51660.1 cation diffusion facilitator family transporter [Cohnella phaseoli]
MATGHHSGLLAIWISLISNIVLTVMKVAAGLLLSSPVLLADGVHNAGDIIATIAALTSSMISNKPADDDHPYGHGKAEVVASAFVAVILALAAFWIAYQSIRALFEPAGGESWLALGAAFLSLVWKQGLYVYTIRIGKATNSKSVLATAYDHLADVYASLAAVIGIGLGILGEKLHWGWAAYGDPIAGIIVSLLVLKLAIEMGREAVDILMEHTVSPDKLAEYEALLRSDDHVKRIDRVRAREHGHYIIVDVRVGIPHDYTIQQGHDISRKLKKLIMDFDPQVIEVMIHLNPWEASELATAP